MVARSSSSESERQMGSEGEAGGRRTSGADEGTGVAATGPGLGIQTPSWSNREDNCSRSADTTQCGEDEV